MRLVFSTSEFVYGGRSRPRFPLILADDMTPAEPFHSFLRHRLLEKGKPLDVGTWEAYGRRIWDFASFLDANGFKWDQPFQSYGDSVVQIYRDWQAQDLGLEPSTINDRLQLVRDCYTWALNHQLIERLPFGYSDVEVRGIEHDLAHVSGGSKTFSRLDAQLDEWEKEPVFLTAEQIKLARSAIRSTTQRLLFDLMARVGLRSTEARTFPRAYVFDPREKASLKPGTLIEVALKPQDMEIKFDKPRVVHVPYSLMEEMHTYTSFERNLVDPEKTQKPLLLTTYGGAYSKGSAYQVMRYIGERVGFRISPLMLRHSYAIHTLLLLRNHPELKLEPLMYVRDRLGHSSVQTTMVYLKQIERLLGAQALEMMGEFDRLYDVTQALSSVATA